MWQPQNNFTLRTHIPFNWNLSARVSGDPTPVITAVGLPPGLSLIDGTVSGTPTTLGNYYVVLTATNVAGTAQISFTITVVAADWVTLIGGVIKVRDKGTLNGYAGSVFVEFGVANNYNRWSSQNNRYEFGITQSRPRWGLISNRVDFNDLDTKLTNSSLREVQIPAGVSSYTAYFGWGFY